MILKKSHELYNGVINDRSTDLIAQTENLKHIKHSFKVLNISTFLQLYISFEEIVIQECEDEGVEIEEFCLDKCKKKLTALHYNVSGENWENITYIAKIRNCMVHTNGRLDLSSKKNLTDVVDNINKKANDSLIDTVNSKISKHIILTEDFLNFVNKNFQAFLISNQQQLKN